MSWALKAEARLRDASPRDLRQLVLIWALLAAGFMLFPFRFDYQGPAYVTNGTDAAEEGGLVFHGPARFRTKAAPEWLPLALAERQLDVRVKLETARRAQQGPARILTLSKGRLERNFMLGQKGEDLMVRVRRPGSDANGAAPLKVGRVFREPAPVDIQVRFRPHLVEVLVDGEPRYREKIEDGGLFGTWDPEFTLALGDEVDGARGWEGQVDLASATVGERHFDLLDPAGLERPEAFWNVPEQTRRLWRFDPHYAIPVEAAHVLIFFPLGALLWLSRRRGGLGPVLRIAFLGLLIGTLFQLTKVAFPGRHPSLYHAPFNFAGAALGALAASLRWKSPKENTP